MQSSNSQYYQGLDHIRAIAAFTVFCWHFIHFNSGQHEPPLVFPLSFLTEGNTGVALFMTLSGYLFAKLTDNRRILFKGFIWNRCIRLLPLMIFVSALGVVEEFYLRASGQGLVSALSHGLPFPHFPSGGWSIKTEFYFYLLLPALLFLTARSIYFLVAIVLLAFLLRLGFYHVNGEIQSLAYWTLVGRIDQFVLGIFMFNIRRLFEARQLLVIGVAFAFLLFWWAFDAMGGFYNTTTYPSPSPIWLILPTIEGLCYRVIIAGYDVNFSYSSTRLSNFVALIGAWSYSLYLMHFFFVFKMPGFIDQYVMRLSNPYLVLAAAVPCFLAMLPVAWLTYTYVERPFLRFRTVYLAER